MNSWWLRVRLLLTVMCCMAILPSTATAAQNADDQTVVLVNETFDNPTTGELPTVSGDDYSMSYDSGLYLMFGPGDDFTGLLRASLYDNVAQGTIAVDVRLRGEVASRYFFIGCRDDGSHGTGYKLFLDPRDGSVALSVEDDENGRELLTDFVRSSAIHTGNRTNRIELDCNGPEITGRVNGVDVVTATDDRYARGFFSLGVGVYSGSSGSIQGVFDNLVVTSAAPDQAQLDAAVERFSDYQTAARAGTSIFGPASGELRNDTDKMSDRLAGVTVRDFYAEATFVNPDNAEERLWDVGIAFRDRGNDQQTRLFVRSNGRWYLTDGLSWPSASGPATGLKTAGGETNTIAIAIVGDTGYLAINEQFVAAFALANNQEDGDIWIGAGFITDDISHGDRIPYRNFRIWPLDQSGATSGPETTTTPGPEATPDTGPSDLPDLPPFGKSENRSGQTATPTPSQNLRVQLQEMDQSGLSGFAALTPEGSRTEVTLRVQQAPGDTIVVIEEGTCQELDAESGIALAPLNQAGISNTHIDLTVDTLLATPHKIVVYDAANGAITKPIVCGEIVLS